MMLQCVNTTNTLLHQTMCISVNPDEQFYKYNYFITYFLVFSEQHFLKLVFDHMHSVLQPVQVPKSRNTSHPMVDHLCTM